MTYKTKRAIKKTAEAGAYGVMGVLRAILKTIGILLLIFITTGAIFACIFVLYIKTNLASSDLGVSLEEYQLNETSIIYYHDKVTDSWVESASIQSTEGYRYWVPYEEIPWYMEKALVAIEDKRFYTHHGVDWGRTAQAFVYMFLGNSTFGGSTITQQLRKNITGENEATVRRKLTEIFAALELEKQYEKWQIIEWYLNVVNFGHGDSKGIGDAARYYFDKEVKDLSLAEAACIIGITNNPSMYNPYYNPKANKARQETILYQMYDQGYIDKQTYEEAKAEHLNFVYATTTNSNNSIYSWFDEVVREDAARFLAEQRGISTDVAMGLLATGGFKIYSTMDPDIQAVVDEVYGSTDYINSLNITGSSQQIQSAIVIMDPYTGDIVALAGAVGKKEGNLLYNLATDARRSPGSSFKPISAYAPAMDFGYLTPKTLYEDSPDVKLKGTDWLPANSGGGYSKICSVRYAIQQSINVVAAQVLDQVTPDVSFDFLTNKLHIGLVPEDKGYAALALGQLNYGVTVREMANAFSIFPNSGMFVESRTFSRICDSQGNTLYENTPDAEPVISDTTAYWMTDMLHNAAVNGTGYEANLGSSMPTAGKTGTTTAYHDRWFVGFTPYYTAAVWTGYPYPTTINAHNTNPASYLWKRVMSQVHADLPYKDFSTPANTYQDPVQGVETVDYYARCVVTDVSGGLGFLKEEAMTGIVGKTVTVKAPEVEGYVLVGEDTQTLTLSVEPEDNVALFHYELIPPPPTEPPPTEPENPPTEPENPPTEPGDTPETPTEGEGAGQDEPGL